MAFENSSAVVALAPIAFAGALLHGVTGFGSAVITIPLAALFLPLPFALAVFAIVDFVMVLRLGLENPRKAVRGEWIRMVSLMLLGTITGTALLVNLPRRAGLLALGILVLSYTLYRLRRRENPTTVGPQWAYLAGFAGGLIGTLFGPGSTPYVIYLSHRPLDKEQFRATITLTGTVQTGLRLVAYFLSGLLAPEGVVVTAAATIPAALVGVYIASKIFHLVSQEALMRVALWLLLATGASLVVRALI